VLAAGRRRKREVELKELLANKSILSQRKDPEAYRRPKVEEIPKADLFAGLKRVTKDCQKGEYSNGLL
jgi:hypothetical protein